MFISTNKQFSICLTSFFITLTVGVYFKLFHSLAALCMNAVFIYFYYYFFYKDLRLSSVADSINRRTCWFD